MTDSVSGTDWTDQRSRETDFWNYYQKIESALNFAEKDFVTNKAVREAVASGVAGCEEVVGKVGNLILVRAGRRPPEQLAEMLVELVRCQVLDPALMGEVLDVHHLVHNAKSSGEWLPVYAGLVRIMEVLEACWKHLERELNRTR